MAKKVDLPEPIIPNDSWKVVKLGQYVKILNGYPFDSSRFTNSNENTYPIIRIRDVVRGYTETFTDEDCPDEYKIKKDEILIGMDGDFNISRWKSDFGLLNQRVCKISTVSKDLDEKFLFYYLPIPLKLINDATPSVTVKHLSSTSLQELHFPLPTLAEQQRIVNRIESMFAKLDEAKEKAQNVVDGFETRKAAILHKAFTGELTANWRKENGVSDDSWEEKRLEEVCDFITKGTTPKKEDMSIGNGEIPYIKVYNLCFNTNLDFTIDPTFVKLESHKNFLARSITLPGDVLMNIVGPPFGKVSIVPDKYPEWNINQAIARFRCKPELKNVYLANYLISPKTIENMSCKIKTTAGQQNLTLEICRNITIPVPTFPEQVEIVRILDIIIEKENKAKQAAEAVLEQIDLLKKSILARAFRGEL